MKRRKITLEEKDIPSRWYNIVPDMPNAPLPPLHTGTKKPISPDMLGPLFPMSLIKQEASQEKWEDIPEEVRDAYKAWRPTPLYRAFELEKSLKTECRSTTSMKVQALQDLTSQTQLSLKHIIIK